MNNSAKDILVIVNGQRIYSQDIVEVFNRDAHGLWPTLVHSSLQN